MLAGGALGADVLGVLGALGALCPEFPFDEPPVLPPDEPPELLPLDFPDELVFFDELPLLDFFDDPLELPPPEEPVEAGVVTGSGSGSAGLTLPVYRVSAVFVPLRYSRSYSLYGALVS